LNIQSAPFLIAYKKGSVAPDTAGATRPSANFVLCRDKYGTPTAVMALTRGILIRIDLALTQCRYLDSIRFLRRIKANKKI